MSKLREIISEQVPKEWNVVPVGKVLVDSQYGTSAPASETGNTKVVGMKDIQQGKILTENLSISNLSEDEQVNYLLKKDDLLINRTNSYDLVGKVGIFKSDEQAAFASYLVRLIPDKEKITPEFLNYWLNSYKAQTSIKRIATRAISQANINPTEFKKHCFVPLPPLREQTAISDVLAACDEAIEKIECLIATKEKQFVGFIQLLVNQHCRKASGRWPVKRLGEVFEERAETGHVDLPLLSVTRESGIIPFSESGRKDNSNEDKSKYLHVCPGDIAYNTMRMWQGVSALSQYEGIVSPAYTVCIPSDELDARFVAHYFKTPWMIHQFYRYSQGLTSDTWNLKFKHFREIKAAIPPLDEQKRIADILDTIRQEINLLKQYANFIRKQKHGLMQKLLTGEWRARPTREVA